MFLAATKLDNPLLWALLIGWIMTVVLHEFAHGIVAYLGGDYTIKERGGLTLNPLQYIDPLMSIILPAVFLLMGGIALPGGATYVRRDLLRSRFWDSAVSAAGPLMNFILFLLLCIPLHPKVGWVDYRLDLREWGNTQIFVAALAFSQILSVILNLVPIPGLDGFGMIAPYLPHDLRLKLTTPPWSSTLIFGYFILLCTAPEFIHTMLRGCMNMMSLVIGEGWIGKDAFYMALHG